MLEYLIHNKNESKLDKKILNQFFRFAISGITATFIHMSTLIVLVEIFRCGPLPASTAGFILAVIVSYIINYHWTFAGEFGHKKHFPKYIIVCLIGFLLNTSIMFITVHFFCWWYVAGQLLALGVVPLNNFILNRYWVFRYTLSQ